MENTGTRWAGSNCFLTGCRLHGCQAQSAGQGLAVHTLGVADTCAVFGLPDADGSARVVGVEDMQCVFAGNGIREGIAGEHGTTEGRMKHCTKGHLIAGINAETFTDSRGSVRVRCRTCTRATVRASQKRLYWKKMGEAGKRRLAGWRICKVGHEWNRNNDKQCPLCKRKTSNAHMRRARKAAPAPVIALKTPTPRKPFVPDMGDPAVLTARQERERVLQKRAELGSEWWKVAA